MEKPSPARFLISSFFVYVLWYAFAPVATFLFRTLPVPEPYHTYVTVMAPSLIMAMGVWAASRWILHIPLLELIRQNQRKTACFFIPFLAYFSTTLVAFLISKRSSPSLFTATHPAATTYLLMLLLILPFNFIQCAAEEYMMRIIPSHSISDKLGSALLCMVLFVIPHLGNTEVAQGASVPLVVSYYAIFGFFGTWFSLLTGGFEFSLGVHMANNLFIALVCNYPVTPMKTSALFLSGEPVGTWKDIAVLSSALFVAFIATWKTIKR